MRGFRTKGARDAYYKAMLGRYLPGDRVSASDEAELRDLLALHPKAGEKIGVGVACFDVRRSGKGSNCFWIIREDGSETDFSYLKCLKGEPPIKAKVSAAFRDAVAQDVYAVRAALFAERDRVPCALTGQLLSVDEGHMDHQPPMTFDAIVAFFLAQESMTHSDVAIIDGGDGRTAVELANPELAQRFRDYHNSVAKLAFVEIHAHLALPKGRPA